jgi:pyridoxal phosphate enzyme (YggS family)
MMLTVAEIRQNYERVLARVAAAESVAGRQPGSVTVVAVTKTWPAETVVAAYEAGIRHIGENRPEELGPKRAQVEAVLGSGSSLVWHLIGPLQSRKTSLAAESADCFHALDRLKIAHRLSNELLELDRTLPVFLEVNISAEASKTGFAAGNWEQDPGQQATLQNAVATAAAMPRIELCGLMTMAPWHAPDEEILSVFQRTQALGQWLQQTVSGVQITLLSMGMTDDFELAIAAGATHVRIGRAIFGPRRT